MIHRLKELHVEMKALKEKASGGAKLTKREQTKLNQLASERDELLTDTLFHTY
jgi:hypothetical protein